MAIRSALAFSLLTCMVLLGENDTRPSSQEQTAMLAAMARFAERYVSNLPNFLCLQVIEQYQGNKKGEHWRKGDTLSLRLAYSDKQEHRTLEQVNNKPLETRNRGWRHTMQTEGEFGPLMANLFSDASEAQFDWAHWEMVSGRRLAVFNYKIDKEHSAARLGDAYVHDVAVPTYGSVSGDPETGEIFKVVSDISEIPSELSQREADTTVTYDYVTIGANKFVLPSHITVTMRTNNTALRNESEFRDYKKFEAESTLKFEGDEKR